MADGQHTLAVSVSYPDFRTVVGPVDLVLHREIGQDGLFVIRPARSVGWLLGGQSYSVPYRRDKPLADPLAFLPIAYERVHAVSLDPASPFGFAASHEHVRPEGNEHWVTLCRSRTELESALRAIQVHFPETVWESVW